MRTGSNGEVTLAVAERYRQDLQALLEKRRANGGDYWATADH